MADREKVIDGLEMLRFFNQRAGRELWTDKPHDIQETDIANADAIFADAITLLKEQESVTPFIAGKGKTFEEEDTWWYACGNCQQPIDMGDRYCRMCGKAVKWNG